MSKNFSLDHPFARTARSVMLPLELQGFICAYEAWSSQTSDIWNEKCHCKVIEAPEVPSYFINHLSKAAVGLSPSLCLLQMLHQYMT